MDEFLDHLNVKRKLGLLQPTAAHLKMRAARTSIESYRQAAGLPPYIDQSEWYEYDPTSVLDQYGDAVILDQQQCSGCTGWSSAGAEMVAHVLNTGEFKRFSGAWVYAQINGGQDNGSVITDAMGINVNVGNVEESDFSIRDLRFTGRQQEMPPALVQKAALYRSLFDVTVSNFQGAVTAILMGFRGLQFAVQVGPNFENFDQYGAIGFDNGPGNHSVYSYSVVRAGSQWALKCRNSWNKWGMYRNGIFLAYQRHFDSCNNSDNAYGHGATDSLPPAPVAA